MGYDRGSAAVSPRAAALRGPRCVPALAPLRAPLLALGLALALAVVPAPVGAQGSATAVLRGEVRDTAGYGVPDVAVVLRDTAGRAVAGTVTDAAGRYVMVGVRAGGPYTVVAERIGYATVRRDRLRLSSGESHRLDLVLRESPFALPGVQVVGVPDPVFSGTRTGAATVIEERSIAAAPTVDRNVVALAAMSPMVAVEGDAVSVAGQNSRFNALRIDGALSQDLFGLSPSGVPGGQANARALPMAAIREYSVAVAPYDVRQSGFTGALLNASTRSGGDHWAGSVSAHYRDPAFSSTADDGDVVRAYGRGPVADFRAEAGAFTVGGPLGPARVFVAGELERRRRPMPGFHLGISDPVRIGLAPASIARLTTLLGAHGVDAGSPDPQTLHNPLGNFFVRLDVPLSGSHELSTRYNLISAEEDIGPNRLAFDTYGLSSAGSRIESRTHSVMARLASRLGDRTTNELSLNIQGTDDATVGSAEPTVEVMIRTMLNDSTPAQRRVRAGSDPLTHASSLEQTVVQLSDRVSHATGDHLLTVGVEGSLFDIRRRFLPASRGVWRFDSLEALEENRPESYERLVLLEGADPEVAFGLVQLAGYVQDEWSVADQLSLTLGLRVDWPLSVAAPDANPEAEAATGVVTDRLPSGTPLFAPRLGVSWRPFAGRRTQLRGGVGVFTGMPPLAWIADAYANTGLRTAFLRCDANAPGLTGDEPPAACADGSVQVRRDLTVFDEGFRFPQDFRASAAVDQELPGGLVGTVEVLYTRAIHQVALHDLNLGDPIADLSDDDVGYGTGDRPLFGEPVTTPHRFGPMVPVRRWDDYGRVLRVGNRSRNAALAVATEVQRRFSERLDLRLAYTFTRAVDVRSLLYQDAALNYGLTPIRSDPARPDVALSAFDRPHRVMATAWTRLSDWGEGLDLSVMYVGQSGTPYSYVYGSDMNGDGYPGPGAVENAYNDLLYMPEVVSEMGVDGPMTRNLLFQLADLEPCLGQRAGMISVRNECRTPWSNRLDLRLAQGVKLPFGSGRFRVDIMNVLNLLDPAWGHVYTAPSAVPVLEVDRRSGCPGALTCSLDNELIARYTGPRRSNPGTPGIRAELPHVLSLPESLWRAQLGLELVFD